MMKERISSILKTILEVALFIGIIIVICMLLGSCNSKKDNETPVLDICGGELDVGDYYSDSIDWKRLEKDINIVCEEHYIDIEE